MFLKRRNFVRNTASQRAAVTAGCRRSPILSEVIPLSRASEPVGPRNENACGPSQRVIASMQDSLPFANRYSDPDVTALRERIAQFPPSSRSD
jgi:histidinol-phosphate/aromatic aminotransferase/cobyric acid decarboxylase-like protein